MLIYSIGYSDYSFDKFLVLLNKFTIDRIIDVRSAPYSKRTPQFNRELLKVDLKERDIEYVYLGDKVGGRCSDPKVLFEDGQVDFEKVRETEVFKQGLEEIIALAQGKGCVALMCAEKDPFNCHRFVLISRALSLHGAEVRHILEDGSYVSNEELEERLLKKYKCDYSQINLFERSMTKEDALAQAYRLRNKDIGYNSVDHE